MISSVSVRFTSGRIMFPMMSNNSHTEKVIRCGSSSGGLKNLPCLSELLMQTGNDIHNDVHNANEDLE